MTSLFELIREQQRADPNRALDYDKFPEPTISGASNYSPGAFDATSSHFNDKSDQWQGVVALIARLRADDVTAAQLELSLASVQAAPNVKEVFRHLTADDVPDEVARLFWAIAKQSREYEAVKWGLAIGSSRFRDEMVPDLLTFARHAEFTNFALTALNRASIKRPELRSYLPPLLPLLRGWGIAHLIDDIVRDNALASKTEVIRAVTVYGVENGDGLLVEFGHVLARQLTDEAFELARSDSRLFVAIVLLMEELLTTDHPLRGGILDVPNTRMLIEYSRLLETTASDIWTVQGLRTARRFFDDPACPLDDREQRRAAVDVLLAQRMTASVVRDGLTDKASRWVALQIIDKDKLLELMPDVERLAADEPAWNVFSILVHHGDRDQHQLLLDLLPKVVDLGARRQRPFSLQTTFEDKVEWEYAAIVSVMGVIGSADAIRSLKKALADFNPKIRRAACNSAGNLPSYSVDDEVVGLLRERADEKLDYVREAAESALAKLRPPP